MALQRNLIANYLGQGWGALMGLVFIPVYISYLGIEAYGLIGLFALLQAWLTLLDMGMTPTLSREMARFIGGARTPQSIRDLLRSIEIVAVLIAGALALAIHAASYWLAEHWLQSETLPIAVVSQALAIMGAVTGLRFVESIYRSSIVGLQHQVLLNAANSVMATLRGLGAVAVLAWVSPTVGAFFVWQGVISLLTLAIFATVTYAALPSAERGGRFSLPELSGVGRFAGGMVGIVFLSLLLMQVDKILLSRLLTLTAYGYYTLAAVAAGALNALSGPITQAWYPRLSQLHASDDPHRLIETYHRGAQLVSVIMGSAAIVVALFAEPLLSLWTQDPEVAARTARLVSLLAIGNLLNGLMRIPYMTQLAFGWTSLAIRINIVAVIVVVPAILWVTPRYGPEGAAFIWLLLNASYVVFGIQLMHRRILMSEKWRWYTQDIAQPLSAALAAAMLVYWAAPAAATTAGRATVLAVASLSTITAAVFGASHIRRQAQAFVLARLLYLGKSGPTPLKEHG